MLQKSLALFLIGAVIMASTGTPWGVLMIPVVAAAASFYIRIKAIFFRPSQPVRPTKPDIWQANAQRMQRKLIPHETEEHREHLMYMLRAAFFGISFGIGIWLTFMPPSHWMLASAGITMLLSWLFLRYTPVAILAISASTGLAVSHFIQADVAIAPVFGAIIWFYTNNKMVAHSRPE